MRNCLVTGGAGFIGSTLVRSLLDQGDHVRVLDNFSTGKPANLAGLDRKIELIEGDLRDPETLKTAVKGMDIIFHHAAMVSVPQSMVDPQSCFEINVHGSVDLLGAARTAGVSKVIQASSSAVYGEPETLPLGETLAPMPLSPYAASKWINEIYGQLFTRIYNFPVVSLRYFNVFGPRQAPDSDYAAAIPIFIRRILNKQQPVIYGDGHQIRDFIYVGDVARANLLASACQAADGETFNICTGREIDLLELLAVLGDVLEFDPQPSFDPPRDGDVYRSIGKPDRAKEILGFHAEISLYDGLMETAQWMKAHG